MGALWSCDFHVAPHWRGKKLGSRIKAALHQQAVVIMAFGVSDKAYEVLLHLGWKPQLNLRRYRLLRRKSTLRHWALGFVQQLNRSRVVARKFADCYELQALDRLPERNEVDTLWHEVKGQFGKVVARSYAYLDWKYQRHPLARYSFISARKETRLAGILVVRYQNERLRIVDYCGPARNFDLKRSLVRSSRLRWKSAKLLTATLSDAEFGEALVQEGFVRLGTRPRFLVYTSDAYTPPSNAGWFIMAGDSDGELLAAAADACDGDRQTERLEQE